MTINYAAKVATSSFLGFLKLLFRWRGSIYQHVLPHFVLFVVVYYALNMAYRFSMDDTGRQYFEMVARYCSPFADTFAVTMVLGFYSSLVIGRWWERFMSLPWPDKMALCLTANLHCRDEPARLLRRTVMRYLSLSYVMTLAGISTAVKKRFPTLRHLVQAGFLLDSERKAIEEMETKQNKYFIPLAWSANIITHARRIGKVSDNVALRALIDELNEFRGCLEKLFNYDWISVPLTYTQVVTISVYTFLLACLMGRQILLDADVYVPLFTFLQFFFYMGWLKVCEMLVNPFGEDDEDFDINMVIDRNLQVSYLIVDDLHCRFPELRRDMYWNAPCFTLPYTAATVDLKLKYPFMGSATDTKLTPQDAQMVYPEEEAPPGSDMETVLDIESDEITPFASPTLRPLFPKEKKKKRKLKKPKKPTDCMKLLKRKDKAREKAGYRDPTEALQVRTDASSGDGEGFLPEAEGMYVAGSTWPEDTAKKRKSTPIYDDVFIPMPDSRPQSLVHRIPAPSEIIIPESEPLASSAIPDYIIPAPAQFQEPEEEIVPEEFPPVRATLPRWRPQSLLYDGDSSPEKPEKKQTFPRIPPEGLYSSPDEYTEEDDDDFFLPAKHMGKLEALSTGPTEDLGTIETLSSIRSDELQSLSSVSLDDLVSRAKANVEGDHSASDDISVFSGFEPPETSETDIPTEGPDEPDEVKRVASPTKQESTVTIAPTAVEEEIPTPTPAPTPTAAQDPPNVVHEPISPGDDVKPVQKEEVVAPKHPVNEKGEEYVVIEQLESSSPSRCSGESLPATLTETPSLPSDPDVPKPQSEQIGAPSEKGTKSSPSTEQDTAKDEVDTQPKSDQKEDAPPAVEYSSEEEAGEPEDDSLISYPYEEVTMPLIDLSDQGEPEADDKETPVAEPPAGPPSGTSTMDDKETPKTESKGQEIPDSEVGKTDDKESSLSEPKDHAEPVVDSSKPDDKESPLSESTGQAEPGPGASKPHDKESLLSKPKGHTEPVPNTFKPDGKETPLTELREQENLDPVEGLSKTDDKETPLTKPNGQEQLDPEASKTDDKETPSLPSSDTQTPSSKSDEEYTTPPSRPQSFGDGSDKSEEVALSMPSSSARWTHSPRLNSRHALRMEDPFLHPDMGQSPTERGSTLSLDASSRSPLDSPSLMDVSGYSSDSLGRAERGSTSPSLSAHSMETMQSSSGFGDDVFQMGDSPSRRRPLHIGQVSPRPGRASWRMATSRMRSVQALAPPRIRPTRRRMFLPQDKDDDSNSNGQ